MENAKFNGYLGSARGELDLDMVIAGQYQVHSTQWVLLCRPIGRSGIIKNACVIPNRTERNTELQNRKIIRVPALICGVGEVESGSRVECVGSGSWSAGQKLRIAESAQHQGKPLSSPLVWNLSQTLALFFRLCSVRWFRLAWFRCAWFGFDAIPFASSLTFSTLLPSNSPSLPLSRSPALPPSLFTRCRVVCVTFRIHLQQRAKKIHNGDKQPLCKTSSGTSTTMTMTGWHSHSQHCPLLPLVHALPFFLCWHILIRNGSILIRIGIAGIVIVVAVALSLSLVSRLTHSAGDCLVSI